jgi:hypothetical protein
VNDVCVALTNTYNEATLDDVRDVIESAVRVNELNDVNRLVMRTCHTLIHTVIS